MIINNCFWNIRKNFIYDIRQYYDSFDDKKDASERINDIFFYMIQFTTFTNEWKFAVIYVEPMQNLLELFT